MLHSTAVSTTFDTWPLTWLSICTINKYLLHMHEAPGHMLDSKSSLVNKADVATPLAGLGKPGKKTLIKPIESGWVSILIRDISDWVAMSN